MAVGETYRGQLARIMRAIVTNYQGITTGNGYHNNVAKVIEGDTTFRPAGLTGPTIVISETPTGEQLTYRPGGEGEATLSYKVEIFLPFVAKEPDDTLAAVLRDLIDDAIAAHNGDVNLAAADASAGGDGSCIVQNHRIRRVFRQYRFPNGYARLEVTGTYFFSADATV